MGNRYANSELEHYFIKHLIRAIVFNFQNKQLEKEEANMSGTMGMGFRTSFIKSSPKSKLNKCAKFLEHSAPFDEESIYALRINLWTDQYVNQLVFKYSPAILKRLDVGSALKLLGNDAKLKVGISNAIAVVMGKFLDKPFDRSYYSSSINLEAKDIKKLSRTIWGAVKPLQTKIETDLNLMLKESRGKLQLLLSLLYEEWTEFVNLMFLDKFSSIEVKFSKLLKRLPLIKDSHDRYELCDNWKTVHLNSSLEEISQYAIGILAHTYLDSLAIQKKHDSLQKQLPKWVNFLSTETLSNFVGLLYADKKLIPNIVVSRIFSSRGGKGNVSNKRLEDSFKSHSQRSNLVARILEDRSMEDLVIAACDKLSNNSSDWFYKYIENENKAFLKRTRRSKSPFAITNLKNSNYKSGFLNYSNWQPKDSRYIVKSTNRYFNRYPAFYWEHGGNPLDYNLHKSRVIRDTADAILRKKLNVPDKGSQKVSESRMFYLLQSTFPFGNWKREVTPYFLGRLRYDFYSEELNIAVEWHGAQHFKPVSFFGGQQGFKETQKRDQRKRTLSKKNGVILIEIAHTEGDAEIVEKITRFINNPLKSTAP